MKDKLPVFTEEEIGIIRKSVPKRDNISMYLHCKSCIPSKMPDGMSPEAFGSYEIATAKIAVGEKRLGVITIWCRNCNKLVWDSRHLQHLY